MTDRFPAEIHIGGPTPRHLAMQLIEVIVAEGVSLDEYGGPIADAESTRFRLHEGAILSLFDTEAAGGQFAELEAFLARHNIHFDRHCDAYHQDDAEQVRYRGGEPVIFPSNHAGELLVRAEDIRRILDQTSANDHEKLSIIQQLVCPPGALPLEPIRFVP